MKCPRCTQQHARRSGNTCSCGYIFLLSPLEVGFSDNKFLATLKAATLDGTRHVTEPQLVATYVRRTTRSRLVPAVVGTGLLGAGGLAAWLLFPPLGVILGLGGVVSFSIAFKRDKPAVLERKFEKALQRWKAARRPLPGVIVAPTLHVHPPNWQEPDIYAYGVERILIVERDILVDMLVRNGVHATERALVISEDGYPNHLLPIAQRLLRQRSTLPVFLLHDASVNGMRMRERLEASARFPVAGHPLTDLGLTHEDAQQLRRLAPFTAGRAIIPIDMLPFGMLIAGLSLGMAEGVSWAELLAREDAAEAGSSAMSFG